MVLAFGATKKSRSDAQSDSSQGLSYIGVNPNILMPILENKVDSVFGLFLLAFGFILQGCGALNGLDMGLVQPF